MYGHRAQYHRLSPGRTFRWRRHRSGHDPCPREYLDGASPFPPLRRARRSRADRSAGRRHRRNLRGRRNGRRRHAGAAAPEGRDRRRVQRGGRGRELRQAARRLLRDPAALRRPAHLAADCGPAAPQGHQGVGPARPGELEGCSRHCGRRLVQRRSGPERPGGPHDELAAGRLRPHRRSRSAQRRFDHPRCRPGRRVDLRRGGQDVDVADEGPGHPGGRCARGRSVRRQDRLPRQR